MFLLHFRFVFTIPALEFAKAKGESTMLELLESLLGQAQTQYYQDLLRWMIMVMSVWFLRYFFSNQSNWLFSEVQRSVGHARQAGRRAI